MLTIFGQKLLSVLCLVSLANGLPAEYNKNTQTQQAADESRQFSRFSEESGFVPIIPTPIDPHPIISLNSDPGINPHLTEQKFFSSHYRNGYLSTSRPFSLRHISSTSTINRHSTPSSSTYRPPVSYDQSILGSGDFAVLRGGTFYPEGEDKKTDFFGSGSIFLDTNTGRPFALPLEQPHYSDDPFANFKDFADITAGVDSDFTNLVVIYANKNSTKHEPRNILEQLQLLDQQREVENQQTEETTSVPIKNMKLSKFKTKLGITKSPIKKFQTPKKLKETQAVPSSTASSIDYVDPLVADS